MFFGWKFLSVFNYSNNSIYTNINSINIAAIKVLYSVAKIYKKQKKQIFPEIKKKKLSICCL